MVNTRALRFAPIERQNLTATLVTRLSEAITSGALEPGDRLPTEQEMTEEFGVSRTVVREAIAALKAEGLVVTRQGAGVFVEKNLRTRSFRIDPDELGQLHEILKVMELRMSVEIEAAALAAERHDRGQLRRIEQALAAIDADIASADLAVDTDFAFHVAVAEATGNQYFSRFLEFLGRFIIPRQTLSRRHGGADAAYLKRVQTEHRGIFEAIAASDPGGAREAMRTHLANGCARYGKLAQELARRQA